MKTKKLTETQILYLRSKNGGPGYVGGGNGGKQRTATVLHDAGLVDWKYEITAAGLQALIDGRYFYSD